MKRAGNTTSFSYSRSAVIVRPPVDVAAVSIRAKWDSKKAKAGVAFVARERERAWSRARTSAR